MKSLRMNFLLGASMALSLSSLPLAAQSSYFEGFEGYANGSSMQGQGGWAGWDNAAAATGYAYSSPFAHEGTNMVQIVGTSDLTHSWTSFTSGQPVLSIWQFLPSAYTGDSFLILLNTYNHGGPYAWSAQLHANATTGVITDDNDTTHATLPLIKGQWVEYRFLINLAGNSVSEYYNNQLLSTHRWYDPADANAAARLAAIDLYGNGAGNVYYDSLSITVVPEPGSLSLLALGGLGWMLRRRVAR